MNDEDIKEFKKSVKLQNNFLKNHIHQSITNLQPVIDKFTTKIYQFLKEEIEELNLQGFNILIFPNIGFYATDVAPSYNAMIEITYYVNLYCRETESVMGIEAPSESLTNKISELSEQEIIIDLEIAPHTKMSLVKEFVQKYVNGQKKY